MAEGVLMPKAGITVEECMITKWEKKVGDMINVGDVLFSYETDKASFECESTAAGELLEIFYSDGEDVPVLVNVCAIGTKGEDCSALKGAAPSAAASEEVAEAKQETKEEDKPEVSGSAVDGDRLKISPRARNLADKNNIDASLAAPTGPYGRIVERDVKALIDSAAGSGIGGKVLCADSAATPAQAAPAARAAAAIPTQIEYEDTKFPKIRSVIAKQMHASLSTAAQLTHHHSFDAGNILEMRKCLKNTAEKLGLPNITLNDIILYAVSRTLPNYPDLNAHLLDGDVMRCFKDVHLGVAIDTPRGLMVPTIFFANHKSLTEIAVEAKTLAKQAQEGSINPDLLQGGTFTVSNLGALGVEMFTPVINAPQTAILGVCNVTTKFKAVGSEVKPYQAMGLSLTYDHRAIDGAPAARFAQELIMNLENFPALLV